jgi:sulfhydrogenase subunit alpha
VVRAIELVFACHEALRVIREYEPPFASRAQVDVRASTGQAATEAPRGLLYHRYGIDQAGLITSAKIVPPTSQNQKRIEEDLWHFVAQVATRPTEEITWKCEQAVRNYDPCISCATHFLTLHVERDQIDPSHHRLRQLQSRRRRGWSAGRAPSA